MDDDKRLLPSCTNLPLDPEELEELVDRAKDWALMHGMGVRPTSNTTKDIIQFAPFALLPSVFPREEFEDACEIQVILNTLMHRVAHDYKFLKETLEGPIRVDPFTRRLFQIYETVYKEGFTQKVSLGLLRSDLMLDSCCKGNVSLQKPFCCWKQVEINTMASGMAWLGPITTKFHQFILTELGLKNLTKYLPDNNALQGICGAIVDAWKIYNDSEAAILFIVEDFSFNICDQRFHEFEIKRQNPNIRVIRRTLTQLASEARLTPKKELIVNNRVIGVVYFRCGYEPGQYPTEREWEVRLLIEKSLAIKSPSIQYHLAGTKKVQQALAKPGVLAQYFKNEKTVLRVKEIFTGLYALGADENENTILEMALADPERFVLKPQREGGGNNIYGLDIRAFLESMESPQERLAWILMDKIHPPPQLNYIVRAGSSDSLQLKQVISELGIFGTIIGDEETIFSNKQVGHSFRTKLNGCNEGGLMNGIAFIDTLPDVIHAVPKYEIDHEIKEIYFFREGTVVMWNIPDLESGNLLQFLKSYEDSSYAPTLVQLESEMMSYTYTEAQKRSHLKDGDIYLALDASSLDKYTFSNAISQSVKLGIWEASLEAYIDSIEFVTEDLKAGRRIKMTREEVLRKQGELFALRHLINLSSDLLDTPDFYWENDELETLYQQTCGYFSIAKRTRVMNEKINHCVELVELLSSHLSDRHHVRLEWMIIVLIMVEVAFETLHYLDRYLGKDEESAVTVTNIVT
ncbi:glutathione synthetase [Diachasma alloeum]|uniref:glutathione synthetase n=1 Tax=Diachasma alloeum TaxID=454923 RepID=UPI0007382A33|nr:glutathione synthetase [Diachasma alloeum]